jgi:hypothetical protein
MPLANRIGNSIDIQMVVFVSGGVFQPINPAPSLPILQSPILLLLRLLPLQLD